MAAPFCCMSNANPTQLVFTFEAAVATLVVCKHELGVQSAAPHLEVANVQALRLAHCILAVPHLVKRRRRVLPCVA